MKEEHGAELEAKILTETKLRNLESQVTNDKEKVEKLTRKLQKQEEENKRVREREREGGRVLHCMNTQYTLHLTFPSPQLHAELDSAMSSAASTVDVEKVAKLEAQLDTKSTEISSLNKTVQSLKQVRPVYNVYL